MINCPNTQKEERARSIQDATMNKAQLSSIISQRVESGNWKEIENFFNRSEFVEHFGITVQLDNPEAPQCEVLEVKPFHLGGLGQAYINGAIISAMFDLSIGLTAIKYSAEGTFGTSNINRNLVKPIENNRFYSIAKCNTKIGNRVFSEATIFNYKDEPCAYATGEIRIGIK